MAKDVDEMKNEVANDEGTDQEEVPNISINDLVLMTRIIDAASQRGAIRGEEMTTVGALRDKIYTVVKAVSPDSIESAENDEGSQEEPENS